jgi:Tol biopolymer transport system component
MQADGTHVRQITNEPGYDGGPFFSPGGKWIVFRTDREEEDRLQIHVVCSDGTGDLAVTNDPDQVNWAPYWHPSEPYLIWCAADHSDTTDRFVPGQVWRITEHPEADVLPVFSPDGKRLMWTSNRTEGRSSQLWMADFALPKAPHE